ncbi:PROTEIN PHOSPHATASE 1 REGULATORY SUBUNIT [Salix purpurea]|uniref:PROTEIN PHOSPHATASE 1 REGULATORY SUBUNIT n=1 Tax=Salix purpurea TaxID=77065 RepID=A0A9Q0VB26_SALPP|nr:PROTEIN PHOSPHATASE 1 REGULATORY SUBUNIT [Salix purpurea]
MNEREETRNSGRAREGPKIPLISCQEFRPLVTVGPYEYGPAGRRYTASDKMKMACQFVQDSVISMKILRSSCGVQTSVVVIENRVKQWMSIINKLMWMACTLVSVALLTLSYIVVGENEKWLVVGVTII